MDVQTRDSVYELVSDHQPAGDQPKAIDDIVARIDRGERHTTLLGATGTGKTFTMANVIARTGLPALILSHNKTLAAQLYEEMRELFPKNAVNYFVSYYDYYQPEAYIPARDIYIEKDASRNDDLDRLRLAATSALLSRQDAIVIASVSCIFGLGAPEAYRDKVLRVAVGEQMDRRRFLGELSGMQYQRSDIDFKRGTYRVNGDVIDLYPAYEQFAVSIELWGDEIEKISLINPTSGEVLADESLFFVFPAVHYVMPEDRMKHAVTGIREELDAQVLALRAEGKLLEAQRLIARTKYDLEMIEEVGYCSGVENYSRWFDGREPGEKPWTLLDYFDFGPAGRGNWLMFIDESHVTVPQVHAMYNGDRHRKQILVEHGFRLPSALDNRPLKFEEFEQSTPKVIYVSATPAPYELEKSGGEIIEQVIRPTGLVDPEIEVRPASGQVPDILEECRSRAERGERVLVTALTKRLCEDLTNYLDQQGLNVRYLHSEIDTLDRIEILRDLRLGAFDVLVGVNLLREGLDLPEVTLVCILDADKTGFLRSPTSLVQTIGRAARNAAGRVFLYADEVTPAMQAAMEETERRRAKQIAFNEAHGIVPQTIKKEIRRGIEEQLQARRKAREAVKEQEPGVARDELLALLKEEMLGASKELAFEKAALIRDQMEAIEQHSELVDEHGRIKRSELEAMVGGGPRKKGRKRGSGGKPGQAGSKAGKTTRGKRKSSRS
ncbi:MAG: excinuclease ABC subunit UvrB [Planctomycetota bacterium]